MIDIRTLCVFHHQALRRPPCPAHLGSQEIPPVRNMPAIRPARAMNPARQSRPVIVSLADRSRLLRGNPASSKPDRAPGNSGCGAGFAACEVVIGVLSRWRRNTEMSDGKDPRSRACSSELAPESRESNRSRHDIPAASSSPITSASRQTCHRSCTCLRACRHSMAGRRIAVAFGSKAGREPARSDRCCPRPEPARCRHFRSVERFPSDEKPPRDNPIDAVDVDDPTEAELTAPTPSCWRVVADALVVIALVKSAVAAPAVAARERRGRNRVQCRPRLRLQQNPTALPPGSPPTRCEDKDVVGTLAADKHVELSAGLGHHVDRTRRRRERPCACSIRLQPQACFPRGSEQIDTAAEGLRLPGHRQRSVGPRPAVPKTQRLSRRTGLTDRTEPVVRSPSHRSPDRYRPRTSAAARARFQDSQASADRGRRRSRGRLRAVRSPYRCRR